MGDFLFRSLQKEQKERFARSIFFRILIVGDRRGQEIRQ